MPTKFNGADLHTYSVFDLYVSGGRFTDDYSENDAVEHYLRLHPKANEAEVRAKLRAKVSNRSE